jgi:hypothetical protein
MGVSKYTIAQLYNQKAYNVILLGAQLSLHGIFHAVFLARSFPSRLNPEPGEVE